MLHRSRILALLVPLILLLTGTAATAAPLADRAGPRHQTRDAASGQFPKDAFLSAMSGGNTVEDTIREHDARADGYRHINTPAMIKRLKELNVTTYTYVIWDSESDWEDLRKEFAPAAMEAGIDIMVYLVPPSECRRNPEPHLDGRCSSPFATNYIRWAKEIAKLSLKYPNVKSWAIDDFLGPNRELFTRDYLRDVRAAMDAINPGLKWYVTLYYGQITPDNADYIKDTLDGVIYPYLGGGRDTIDPTWLERRLDGALEVLQPAELELVLLVYTGRFLSGVVPPDSDYVTEIMGRAAPYLANGRISGIIAYAAPLRLDHQQPSRAFRGRTGRGSLSLSLGNRATTVDGSYAAASQQIVAEPGAGKTLTFYHHDWYVGELTGYQFKQVLVDGDVVWEQDIMSDPQNRWVRTEINLTEALAGKKEATLTFRLFHRNGVGWWPVDVRIDDVQTAGFTVESGGFERSRGWNLHRNQSTMQPYIDIYHPDSPTRVFNAISSAYASFQGEVFTPVEGGEWPSLRIGRKNNAMYGNGRLEFTVPGNTSIPATTCATAWQEVEVTPGLPRYELNFWHVDQVQVRFGEMFKQIRIDGQILWEQDVGDAFPWFYMQGNILQGPIDVTEFVKGKESVRLEFRVCTKGPVDDYDPAGNGKFDIGFDHIKTIGLDLVNGNFESSYGWPLQSAPPVTGSIDIHGPCQADNATVITGQHEGPLKATGTTCLQGATIEGPVTATEGASLYSSGGSIEGAVRLVDADSIVLVGTHVTGPVRIESTNEEVRLDHLVVSGPVELTRNVTTPVPIVLTGNVITGRLACTGNEPAPQDLGKTNNVHGPVTGQCKNL